MSQVVSVALEDGSSVMIESSEEVGLAEQPDVYRSGGRQPVAKGLSNVAIPSFQSIQETIRSYTSHTLKAFEDLAAANVDKVTLEFGIKIGGEAGIPYITKGTAESNLKITVQCSFPEKEQ